MLRVLTLNLWNLSGDWRARREEIVLWLRRLEPDVVCLQEVIDDGDRNTARWLAERTGYSGCAFGGAAIEGGNGARFGNAVLSRSAIDHEATHLLPSGDPRPEPIDRLVLHARTSGLDVFCTHLTSLYPYGNLREQQVLRLDEVVREHADPEASLPPILAGDFNADPESDEIRFLCGNASIDGRSTYYQEAWRVAGGREAGITWSNDNPFAAAEHEPERRIDYVFVGWRRPDGRGTITACSVVCDRPLTGVHPTDHYGVLADIAT
ncbi:MAG TPA: endonuclease/exonuclease/phosphatase family protein [Acidimicrobiales bacterium]|nr:endonuclease/exonuclease/phosphatase family protein [Acidimicrobiales bacterium]